MSKKDQDPRMEESDAIQVGNGNIGTFNKLVYLIITIICLLYLVLHFRP